MPIYTSSRPMSSGKRSDDSLKLREKGGPGPGLKHRLFLRDEWTSVGSGLEKGVGHSGLDSFDRRCPR